MQISTESPSTSPSKPQDRPSPLDDDFAQLVASSLERWKVPGMAIGVIDGADVWHKGYGVSDISTDTPVTPRTNFYAGSTTKAFTAAAVGLLVHDPQYGDVESWRTPVSQLIREDFGVGGAENDADSVWATANLTLEDILTHRTGMPAHDQAHGRAPTQRNNVGEISDQTPESKVSASHDVPRSAVRDVVRQLRHLPLTASPRATYQYCNIMYVAASHVVECVTGQWLGSVVRERIWKPLDLDGTYFSTEDALRSDQKLAKGYRFDTDTDHYVEIPFMNLDGTSGAGSVISNVVDYAKWSKAVMETSDILNPALWKDLLTPRTVVDSQTPPFAGPSTYALGWNISTYKGHRVLHHTGAMNAYGALFILFPDIRYGVIAFANTAGSSVCAQYALLWHLIDNRLCVPAKERYDWDSKKKAALRSGIEAARTAKARLYPHIASPPLPLSLPLALYSGTYYDPGYQTLSICLTDQSPSKFLRRFMNVGDESRWLVAARKDVTWPEFLTFEHVSGEYFVAWAEHEGDYGAWYPEAYPVQFCLSVAGHVEALKIGWEEKMGAKRIHMRRIGKGGGLDTT